MKKNEKRMILILIVVAVIIIAALVKMRGSNNDNSSIASNENATATNTVKEEFVQVLEDGSKLNTSSKLAETKTFGNFEVSNIQLTEQDGQSLILADVKNTGTTKTDVVLIDITLLDKNGNEITTIGGIVGDIEPGATTQLNAAATMDFANAYDFSIKVSDETMPTETEPQE